MTCEQALEALSARLDGELTEEESGALEAHLAACPSCRALAQELARLSLDVGQAWEEPPEGFRGRVLARAAEEPRRAVPRHGAWRRWAGLAAAAALAAVVTLPRLPVWPQASPDIAPVSLDEPQSSAQALDGAAPGLSTFGVRQQSGVSAPLPAEDDRYGILDIQSDHLPQCLAGLDWQDGTASLSPDALAGVLDELDAQEVAYTWTDGSPLGTRVEVRWQAQS